MPPKNGLSPVLIVLIGAALAGVILWRALETRPDELMPELRVEVQNELQTLKRQFQTTEDFQSRLAGQGLSEKDLKKRIAKALAVQNALEAHFPPISEAEARAWYEAHRESLRIPQAWHAAHIFLTRHDKTKPDREAEMRGIHQRLAAGELAFAAAVERFSEDERTKRIAGDLGWFTRERMPEAIIAAVARLRPGGISGPVLSPLGWHVIRLIEQRPPRVPSYEEARDEIMAVLDLKRRQQALPKAQ